METLTDTLKTTNDGLNAAIEEKVKIQAEYDKIANEIELIKSTSEKAL
jgi:hypothetical protein